VKPASIIGLGLVAAHAVAFVAVVPSFRTADLAIEIPAQLIVGPEPSGTLPAALEDRATHELAGTAGLRHARYSVSYRGGFTRTVGVSGLVGPFQDPEKPECTGRVVVGQKLLDDGKAGPSTIAGELARTLEAEMKGESFVGIGKFEGVAGVSLRWAQVAGHPEDCGTVEDAPHGYVRATARLEFDRIDVPIVVALIPQITRDKLDFKIVARAQLELGNSALQWISDKLGGDKLATRLARREIEGSLITALAPPPPFDLPGGHQLTFGYCDGPPQIIDGHSGALPFSVHIKQVGGTTGVSPVPILPPRRGPTSHAPLPSDGSVAIDLDLDAANALLFELWRVGFLDQQLAAAGLDKRFNTDPIVTEFLSLRISPPVLALPPVLGAGPRGLQLFADARVTIADGETKTVGRVWGGLDFGFAKPDGKKVQAAPVNLGALELSCEETPTRLVPCYADLVGAMRDRGPDFQGELTNTFAKMLADIFVDQRVGASGLSADLMIRGVTPTAVYKNDNGSLHLELDAVLAPKR
jgi:hypothetical protein